MAWQDRLKPASFRGVAFYVDSNDITFSRRISEQRFPGREYVRVQDLGREANVYSVTAHVIGSEYDIEAESLMTALAAKGSGKLVLPWYQGERLVFIRGPIRMRETVGEKGRAVIQFEAIEADRVEQEAVFVQPDTRDRVAEASAALHASCVATMADVRTAGVPSNFLTSATTSVTNATAKVKAARLQWKAKLGIDDIISTTQQVDNLFDAIDRFAAEVASLIATPAELGASLIALTQQVLEIEVIEDRASARFGGVVKTTVEVGADLAALGDDVVLFGAPVAEVDLATGSYTANEKIEANNLALILGATRASLIAALVDRIAREELDSRSQALATMTTVSGWVDDAQAFISAPQGLEPGTVVALDALYAALDDLRATAYQHLSRVASTLPEVGSFTPRQELPALVLAQMLYGDATREEEIVGRNNPSNPAALSVDVPVEYLRA
jgi:prophage DNA circulation protein